MTCCY